MSIHLSILSINKQFLTFNTTILGLNWNFFFNIRLDRIFVYIANNCKLCNTLIIQRIMQILVAYWKCLIREMLTWNIEIGKIIIDHIHGHAPSNLKFHARFQQMFRVHLLSCTVTMIWTLFTQCIQLLRKHIICKYQKHVTQICCYICLLSYLKAIYVFWRKICDVDNKTLIMSAKPDKR